jgi:hypothetical protein
MLALPPRLPVRAQPGLPAQVQLVQSAARGAAAARRAHPAAAAEDPGATEPVVMQWQRAMRPVRWSDCRVEETTASQAQVVPLQVLPLQALPVLKERRRQHVAEPSLLPPLRHPVPWRSSVEVQDVHGLAVQRPECFVPVLLS